LRAAIPELHALSVQQRSGKDPILHQAPGILVLHATQSSPTGHDDCLLTAMAAMLAAPARGLGTCMIGFALIAFQQQRSLRTLIGIPENHHVYAVIAVGYAATHFRGVPDQPSIPVRWL
ncbi:MAG TPA: nitroreductase family protein, partial [Armatimonadota bacterium]|nr:nitroreductase family protein [Armatimonadota bacterium]